MSLIRKHGAVLQAWACLDLVLYCTVSVHVRMLVVYFYVPISQVAISAVARALYVQLSLTICTYVILCLIMSE